MQELCKRSIGVVERWKRGLLPRRHEFASHCASVGSCGRKGSSVEKLQFAGFVPVVRPSLSTISGVVVGAAAPISSDRTMPVGVQAVEVVVTLPELIVQMLPDQLAGSFGGR